jgi:hypothetical protein
VAQIPREVVTRTLRFESPDRMPVDVWVLPWAQMRYPGAIERLRQEYPQDILWAPDVRAPSSVESGDKYAEGTCVDDWGCVFVNIHAGVIGEVREPVLPVLDDWKRVAPPYETLRTDAAAARDAVNEWVETTDRFTVAQCLPRPWERYQFLRGTANALMDLADPDERVRGLLKAIHDFYMKELEFWVSTDVDAIWFMDDWGSQQQLLIPPALWRDLFKPLYRDYCDLARSRGKFAMMHSDGEISVIYPDLAEVGVDAMNSQLFCMDLAALAESVKGRITFWGEIDRQHVLPGDDPDAAREAVGEVARHLYDPAGGIIAQFELGPGANPDNAFAVLDEWQAIQAKRR